MSLCITTLALVCHRAYEESYKAEQVSSILVSAYMKEFLHVSQLHTDCTPFVLQKEMCTCLHGYTHTQSSVATDEWSMASKMTEGTVPPRLFLYFNLINVFRVFDPGGFMCVSFLFRYEARRGACVNRARERDSEGRGAMETKIGVDMKGTRCDSTQIAQINQLPEWCMLGTWRCACLCHVPASPRFDRHRKAQSLLFFFSQSVSSSLFLP